MAHRFSLHERCPWRHFSSSTPLFLAPVWLILLGSALLGCGKGRIGGGERDPREALIQRVDTLLESTTIAAGSRIDPKCLYFDGAGAPLYPEQEPEIQWMISPAGSFDLKNQQGLTALQAGKASLRCALPSRGLVDDTPVELSIEPGPVHTVQTVLPRVSIGAGEDVVPTCAAFDALGNRIPQQVIELVVTPQGKGIEVRSERIHMEKSGVFRVLCHVPGAAVETGSDLEVVPGLPASLVIQRVPDLTTYEVGQVVAFGTLASDRFGNLIPRLKIEIGLESAPAAEPFGVSRLRFVREGSYTIRAALDTQTDSGKPLAAQTTLVVNSLGASIQCLGPADGDMVQVPPGESIPFSGRAVDGNGVAAVWVNGQDASLAADGSFTAQLQPVFGLNLVEVEAEDRLGVRSRSHCAFLASDRYVQEQDFLDGAISLGLSQEAVDDRNGTDGLDSLGDLLATILNSEELREVFHAAASNLVVKPRSCDVNAWLFCAFSSGVKADDARIEGPNGISLTLEDNGLRLVTDVGKVGVHLDIESTLGGFHGWVTAGNIHLDLSLAAGMENHRPRVTLGQVHGAEVQGIDLRFEGWKGFLINIVEPIIRKFVANKIRDTLVSYLQEHFNQTLDGLLGSLATRSLGASIAVPTLSGNQVALGVSARVTDLAMSSRRALFGLGLTFSAPAAHARPSLGVPLRTGAVLLDGDPSRPVTVGVHVGALNQILHALWRAGLLQGRVSPELVKKWLPAEATIQLEGLLPPLLDFDGAGQTRLLIGGLRVALNYPRLSAQTLSLRISGAVGFSTSLQGEALSFADLRIQDLRLAFDDLALAPATSRALDELARKLLQGIAEQTLSRLPALPVPDFAFPASLARFGLPPGQRIGLRQAALLTTATHALLEGAMGLR